MNSNRTIYQRSFLTAGGRAVLAGILAGTLTLGMAGCAAGTAADSATEGSAGSAAQTSAGLRANVAAMDFEYSSRDVAGTYDEASAVRVDLSAGTVEGAGAAFDAASNTLTVSQEGTYLITGALAQGQIVVDADHDTAKVQLVLNGASITNATGPAVYVKSADKVFVTTAEGSENTLSCGSSFTLEEGEDEPDATVFSKDDLTLNGTGTLVIEGNYQNAVTSKDDLVIGGGTYMVTAVEHGLKGKDSVKMADGTVTVTAGGDGVRSTNDEETSRGFVSIDGGTLTVDAGDDGIDAQWYFRVMGGTVNVTAADDAFHSESDGLIGGGELVVNAGDDAFHTEYELTVDDGTVDVQSCAEGYESQLVVVNGGYSNLVASDDAINAAVAQAYVANSDGAATGDAATAEGGQQDGQGQQGTPGDEADQQFRGQQPEAADGQGQTAGEDGQFQGGRPRPDGAEGAFAEDGQPPEMPQGDMPADGTMPEMPQGDMPTDGQQPPEMPQDGQMPEAPQGGFDGAAPQDGNGPRGGFGGGMMGEVSEDCLIQINGGTIVVKAGGDGLDSNGYLEMNGGTVYVSDVSNGIDGALDYELGATFNGGAIIAVGPAGMAMGFTEGSAPFAMVNASGSEGDVVALVSEGGEVLASMTAQGAFQNVVVASAALSEGEAASLVVGGTVAGGDDQGIGGTVSGGAAVDITVSTTAAQTGGMGGGMGGRGGQMPDGAQGQAPNGAQGQALDGSLEAA